MASAFISSPAEIVLIDSRTRSGTVTLPVTNSIPFRVLSFKDQYGSFSNSTLTVSTQVGESFDDGTTTKTFSNAFTSMQLYATSSKWMVLNATQTVQQTISSLIVNQLIFGTGAGWTQFGPVQASIVSSIQTNTNDAYANNLYVGNQSTLNDIMFYGLFGNYNNTVLAEVSTGAGTQEFLVFKGSSTSDRVRVQTTGTFVVETGVSARLFSNTTVPTLSNATPAFIINTSSNVGIQTASPGATLDVAGTARAVTLSSQQLFISSLNGDVPIIRNNILSTVAGLGSIGYLSSLNGLRISTGAVTASSLNLVDPFTNAVNFLTASSGVLLLNGSGITGGAGAGGVTQIVAGTNISISPVGGTGVVTINTSGVPSTENLRSSLVGLGTLGYVSTLSLTSSLVSTTFGLQTSGFLSSPVLLSTIDGLGSAGYISTLSLTSSLISTTNAMNTAISSFSTALGPGGITLTTIASTVTGLGSAGYISTLSLTSSLISTTNAMNTAFSSFSTALGPGGITLTTIASTVTGLGSAGYISTLSLTSSIVSTTRALQTAGFLSSLNLLSTVTGLGSAGYVSSLSVTSSINAAISTLSTAYLLNFNTVTSIISALTVSSLTFGVGDGFLAMPDIRPLSMSTLVTQTSSLQAANLLLGTTSSVTAIQYFGLQGAYANTVIAERSTGTGTQEFLVFKGSSASDQIRFQTTGNFIVEPGVSARLWPTATQNATPALIVNTSSNVGIQTAVPGAALDVAGTGRFQIVSTQQLNVSSIAGISLVQASNLISTVEGLGSSQYVSTLSLVSTTSSLIYGYGIGLSTLSTAIVNTPFIYPGQLLYLNYSISTGTPNYKALQTVPLPLNVGVVVSTPLAGNTISTVAAFQSDFFVPTFIPSGFWENRLFAYASGANVTSFVELYDRSPLGVESLIKTTSTATTSILAGSSPQENLINMNVPYTPISTGHTIVWKIFASNSAAVPRTMYSYFEDGNTYSYLITTFGGTAGYNFPAAFSTLALFTSNTSNYFSSQLISTNQNLVSTVTGLGSTGYVSTLSNVLYMSTQQLYASSIFATLAGPTTVVLYEV